MILFMTREELWRQWKENPTDQNLSRLMNSFSNEIQKRVSMFNAADMPRFSMEIAAKNYVLDAFNTYDPSKHASLYTHVYNHLKRLSRYVGNFQNIGKIPEHRRRKIHEFRLAKGELEQQYNRSPNIQELADKLVWPKEEVLRIEQEMKSSTISSARESSLGDVIFPSASSRQAKIVRNVYYELSPEEKLVYEYLLGRGGKPKLSETEIARQLNYSTSKVSRIKSQINNKIERWI